MLVVDVDLVEGDHVVLLEDVKTGHVGHTVGGGEDVQGMDDDSGADDLVGEHDLHHGQTGICHGMDWRPSGTFSIGSLLLLLSLLLISLSLLPLTAPGVCLGVHFTFHFPGLPLTDPGVVLLVLPADQDHGPAAGVVLPRPSLLLLLVLLLLLHLLFLLLVLKESFMPAAVCHGWQHVYTANIPTLLLRVTKNSLARNEESTVITKCEWKKSKV